MAMCSLIVQNIIGRLLKKSLTSSNTQASESSRSLREAVHENKKK